MLLTLEMLKKIMPRMAKNPLTAAKLYPDLVAALTEAGIVTKARIAAFLGQVAHESVEFRYMEEIADGSAYEGRHDLGNVNPGDGRLFKGRGPIQLTGRNNYRLAGKALGLPLEQHPEMVADPKVGFRVAGWFWTTHGLNQLADQGDFLGITKRVNGGFNGQSARQSYYDLALSVLPEA